MFSQIYCYIYELKTLLEINMMRNKQSLKLLAKKTIMKKKANSKRVFIISLVFLIQCSFNLFAQITFESNISLPDNSYLGNSDYASGAIDIITANNKVFVYTFDKILVLSSDGQSVIATIPFTEKYGKFNPVIENSRAFIADINFMTVFINEAANDREDLYVVTPNLDILLINTSANLISDTFNVSASIPHLKPLHGVCIIKYDDVHNRLYWLLKGRQVDTNSIYNQNGIGHFHYRETYFAIYNVQSNGTINTTPIHLFNELTLSGGNYAHYRDINICDFEFNRNDFSNEDDYFYLAKYNEIEVWGINNTTQVVSLKHEIPVDNFIYGFFDGGEPRYYKFSKLLYINQLGGIHKVVALPYRYPGINLLDPENHPPQVYVIDCNNTNVTTSFFLVNSVDSFDTPNQSVYDAVYLPATKDLAMCFSANTEDQLSPIDIAVYDFDPNSTSWLDTIATFLTSSNPVAGIDINTPTNLLKINNAVLVNKKDEIIKLYPSGNSYNIASPPLVTGENNFFRKGAVKVNVPPERAYVINSAGGKIESFNLENGGVSHLNSFGISYPVHHTVPNTAGTKQYFFNKLNIENAGFFVYDSESGTSFNINEDIYPANDFTSVIGDVIYNSFTNEFLVSQNIDLGNDPTTVKRYNSSNQVVGEILMKETTFETNYQYAKEVFIDPNGILYVMVNMAVGDISNPNNPIVLMYNANSTTYEFIGSHELALPEINQVAEYYMAHFCYSKSNSTVYLAVTPQELSLVPYQSEFNTMINPNNDPVDDPTNNGRLYSINENHELTIERESLVNPGKIICPDDGDDTNVSDFEGKVFILSDQLVTFYISNKSVESLSRILNDIIYSPVHDRLFGFADDSATCNTDRKAVVYEITYGIPWVFTPLFIYEGQIASFFLSPYNDKLYLHTKFDKHKLGGTPSQLIPFNLFTNIVETEINLQDNFTNAQNMSAYPEFDHCTDYKQYNYNLTTPYFNTAHNKIYLPNGAHSNVSVLSVTDQLALGGEVNWISIPRHTGNNTPGYTPIADVFDDDNFENDYNTLHLSYLNPEAEYEEYYKAIYTNYWTYLPSNTPEVERTRSTRGYKLSLDSTHRNNMLNLSGVLENPATPISLYSAKDNWAGYFLYQRQDIFDALGLVANHLLKIEAETWCCVYLGPYTRNSSNPHITYGWDCTDEVHNIDYGEMVVLTADYLPPGYSFTWQGSGQPVDGQPRDETEYFTYTETADYTPVFVLLDSTDNPSELATYVNDSCVGACIVLPRDTMVGILAYLDGQAGDSITFEAWYNTKSTARRKINSYSVYNPNKERYEQRSILVGENRDFYKVSFRKHKPDSYDNDMQDILTDFRVYPNPSSQNINIEYWLHNECLVNVEVYDIYGRRVAVIVNSNQLAGVQKLIWELNGNSGQQVGPGIYTIKIVAGGETVTKKVVIN